MFKELAKQYLEKAFNYQGHFTPDEVLKAGSLYVEHRSDEDDGGYNPKLEDAYVKEFGSYEKITDNEVFLYGVLGSAFIHFVERLLIEEASSTT